jgi:SAM-dependent methyltransferase
MSSTMVEPHGLKPRKHDPHPSALQILADLYRRQQALSPHDSYLLEHASPAVLANQVRTFDSYLPYLPPRGTVLDWGCNHAPDSCLLRAVCGDRFELHGCDFASADTFRIFHEFAGLSYTRITDPLELPYPACSFDAVIASGTLEHTALDYEALKNVYRVLKPGGVLVISYLPNWLSRAEWVRRNVSRRNFHRRLYGQQETRQLLKRTGFMPLFVEYHTFFWYRNLTLLGLGRWKSPLSRFLHRVLPVHWFAPAHWAVAHKVQCML